MVKMMVGNTLNRYRHRPKSTNCVYEFSFNKICAFFTHLYGILGG